MAMKMPRATIEELEGLVEQLNKPDPQVRDTALLRLEDHERSGRVPLASLLEFCDSDNLTLSMYAISALGRNAQPAAVKKLGELAERHRGSNPLFLETIIDALGETRSPTAAAPLLALLGIRKGWKGKLLGRRKPKPEEEDTEGDRLREQIALPVVRALEKIESREAAELLGDFLEHPDPLVRWHTLQNLIRCNVNRYNARIKQMASEDAHDLVREAAEIALDRLAPLPPNLNN